MRKSPVRDKKKKIKKTLFIHIIRFYTTHSMTEVGLYEMRFCSFLRKKKKQTTRCSFRLNAPRGYYVPYNMIRVYRGATSRGERVHCAGIPFRSRIFPRQYYRVIWMGGG